MSDKTRETDIRAAEGTLDDFERMWRRAMKREVDILADDEVTQGYATVTPLSMRPYATCVPA